MTARRLPVWVRIVDDVVTEVRQAGESPGSDWWRFPLGRGEPRPRVGARALSVDEPLTIERVPYRFRTVRWKSSGGHYTREGQAWQQVGEASDA
jgi:hypothetical protein